MKDDARAGRQEVIEAAAYDLLREHGFGGFSMLRVAKAAKASNETLYRWYGDKAGLVRALVDRNVEHVRARIEETADATDPMETLRAIAPVLLTMLVGDRAVTLTRAAAADPSGVLGGAIAAGGRDTVAPLVGGAIARVLKARGSDLPVETATTLFLNLLIGDVQIRRVIGVLPPLTEAEGAERVALTFGAFDRIIGDGQLRTAHS